MKTFHIPFIVSLVGLAACSSVPTAKSSSEKDSPETVEITYHVQQGRELEMQAVLSRAWTIYNTEHLVFPQPHFFVVTREYGNRPRIVETFTWVSHSAPDHASNSVKEIWGQMQDLCEARGGHDGLEINEINTQAPKR